MYYWTTQYDIKYVAREVYQVFFELAKWSSTVFLRYLRHMTLILANPTYGTVRYGTVRYGYGTGTILDGSVLCHSVGAV